ncbi:uncharacterized protein Dana_GF16877 [Drosophila ananassae]|uniref:Adenosine deaminase n=1 Tax=Drosophila ananassae TaxID=7217 RepID=B3LWV5_DROAN|nr:adenosine deaminase 2 [Drosophila ananassae]EDV42743.1 uncharacterized protein Dana_GF16877 [Drosophila ananassae]
MIRPFLFLILVLISFLLIQARTSINYDEARRALLTAEENLLTGGHTYLSEKEIKANEIFMQYKIKELDRGFENEEENAAALHFFKAKPLIDKSKVFQFLHRMPKGAVLHLHNSASVSSEWVVKNISYYPGLLRCTTTKGKTVLTFRRTPIGHHCQTEYVLVSDERGNASDPQVYDQEFEHIINMYTPHPELEYSTTKQSWTRFQDMFDSFNDALAYLPVFQIYTWRALEELYNDNIMYAELRSTLRPLYGENGTDFPIDRTIQVFHDLNEKFIQQHPDFLGIKIIFSAYRGFEVDRIKNILQDFKRIHKAMPNFVVGFDLLGQEDKGKPLYDFWRILKDFPPTARFFFHGGETNWFGASTDLNLLDALLLNTTRIGHGYALAKHPIIMSAIKNRKIAVEVSPISNQVLNLVWDLRNHPGALFLAQDVPMVICSDDPGFWNAKGLSYDLYYAIMSLAPKNAGLRLLKTLVGNSIRYSAMTKEEKSRSYQILEKHWSIFIDKVLEEVDN